MAKKRLPVVEPSVGYLGTQWLISARISHLAQPESEETRAASPASAYLISSPSRVFRSWTLADLIISSLSGSLFGALIRAGLHRHVNSYHPLIPRLGHRGDT